MNRDETINQAIAGTTKLERWLRNLAKLVCGNLSDSGNEDLSLLPVPKGHLSNSSTGGIRIDLAEKYLEQRKVTFVLFLERYIHPNRCNLFYCVRFADSNARRAVMRNRSYAQDLVAIAWRDRSTDSVKGKQDYIYLTDPETVEPNESLILDKGWGDGDYLGGLTTLSQSQLASPSREVVRRATEFFASVLHPSYFYPPLATNGYPRATKKTLKIIIPRHNKLSEELRKWLTKSGYRVLGREKNRVDILFQKGNQFYRAELKVCSGLGSTQGIREAIGQLLEYNYYPGRSAADSWVIVLDRRPRNEDINYIRTLKRQHNLPLSLGWRERADFKFPKGLRI